jgi:hypothetical protein
VCTPQLPATTYHTTRLYRSKENLAARICFEAFQLGNRNLAVDVAVESSAIDSEVFAEDAFEQVQTTFEEAEDQDLSKKNESEQTIN